MGIGCAIGISLAVVVNLTFTPALLFIFPNVWFKEHYLFFFLCLCVFVGMCVDWCTNILFCNICPNCGGLCWVFMASLSVFVSLSYFSLWAINLATLADGMTWPQDLFIIERNFRLASFVFLHLNTPLQLNNITVQLVNVSNVGYSCIDVMTIAYAALHLDSQLRSIRKIS